MSDPLYVGSLAVPRPLHAEELGVDAPFSAALAQAVSGLQNAHYEYLTDTPAPGNAAATLAGHAHGRGDNDGIYVARHAAQALGFLAPQSTSSQSFVTAGFTRLSLGGPDITGEEIPGTRLLISTPSLYLDRDYQEIHLTVLLSVAGSGRAEARLSLLVGDAVLTSVTASTQAAVWTPVPLHLSVPDTGSVNGFCRVRLEYRATDSGGKASLACDDPLCKPMPGTLSMGVAWLQGVPA